MNVLKSTSSSYVQNMIENMVLTSYLDKPVVLCRRLRWTCCKYSNDVARQVETPSKRTVLLSRDIIFMSHRWLRYTMTAKQVSAAIDVFLV